MMWPLLLFLAALSQTEAYRVVCYYTNWAQYRDGKGTFMPEDVNPYLCTHVIYAFAKPVGTTIQPFEWNDDSTEWSKGMFERIMPLKTRNPNLKILLAVGGYNMASAPFIPIVENAQTRAEFATNAITFLRARDFDGIDMDWEYPGSRGSTAADKQKLVLLMQEMRHAFEEESLRTGKSRLLLTAALPAGKENIDNGYNIPELLVSMDFVSIMTYDYHGSWEPYTGINSPLYAHPDEVGVQRYLNLDWTVNYYMSLGAAKDKVNIGLATYGRSFTLDSTSNTGIMAPASQPGTAGMFTRENGFLAYYEICDMIHSGARVTDVPSQRNRYLVQGNQWVGYDDVPSIKEKACYVKTGGFGGIMFWALDLDDFSGQTCKEGTYPLLNAVINEMNSASTANCPSQVSTGPIITSSPTPPTVTTTPGTVIQHTTEFNCHNKADDYYVDPYACDHHYICANQEAFIAHCKTGFLFNPVTKECDYSSNVNCLNPVNPTSTPRPDVTTTAPRATPSQVSLCAGKNAVTVPHPSNCHKFYVCTNGQATEVDCQSGLVFDVTQGMCEYSDLSC